MGRYDKMTNNLDNETLKAKSSRMKIQNTLGMIDDLLELTRSILQECDKDPDKNDLAIKYLLNQRQKVKFLLPNYIIKTTNMIWKNHYGIQSKFVLNVMKS